MSKLETTLFIQIALDEAQKAKWPFGAVIVRDGEIVSQSGSGDSSDLDPTAHAEVNAIREACKKLNTEDLTGCILYSSCEPCALCFGACWYAEIKEIVYGTSLEDIQDINKAWGGDLGFPKNHIKNTGITMKGGILKDDILDMYKNHFAIRRFLK